MNLSDYPTMTEHWLAEGCFRCTRDQFGPVYCDAHRPPPPPDPPGACVLCHFVGTEPMVTGKDGIKWHAGCAK